MGQDFFTYLPSEMIINILSRLPIRSIIRCKCVCKSWLDLLATPEFVKSHLSKSVEGLALFRSEGLVVFRSDYHPQTFKFFEFVDELNLNRCELGWDMDTVFNVDLPCSQPLHSSANGLLFLCRSCARFCSRNLFILCNPITRDCIMIRCPHEYSFSKDHFKLDTCGFGVSRMSGQYKLVRMLRMLHGWMPGASMPAESECQVYTVGTGSWRRISSDGRPLLYRVNDVGVFLNGNLHWLAREREGSSLWISCLDLETELFSTFSPPVHLRGSHTRSRALSALGECLCLCDNSADDKIVIWLMKEYGDEKSWTKEFVISKIYPVDYYGILRPIKVFEKGGILMSWESGTSVLYFSSNTKTIRKLDLFEWNVDYSIHATIYTPSFVSLKTFAMENVTSF